MTDEQLAELHKAGLHRAGLPREHTAVGSSKSTTSEPFRLD